MKIYVVLWHCRTSRECLGVFSELEDAQQHREEINKNGPSSGHSYIQTLVINEFYPIPDSYR